MTVQSRIQTSWSLWRQNYFDLIGVGLIYLSFLCYCFVVVFFILFDYFFPIFSFISHLIASFQCNTVTRLNTEACYLFFFTFVSFTVDGGFGLWSSWTACSKTCGTGSQSRSRPCNNPTPTGGGQNCTGDSSQAKSCKIKSCPGEEFLLCVSFYEGQTKCIVYVNVKQRVGFLIYIATLTFANTCIRTIRCGKWRVVSVFVLDSMHRA